MTLSILIALDRTEAIFLCFQVFQRTKIILFFHVCTWEENEPMLISSVFSCSILMFINISYISAISIF